MFGDKRLLPTPTMKAHRASYILHYRQFILPHILLRHLCDFASCVNYYHLQLGSRSDNMHDRLGKQCNGMGYAPILLPNGEKISRYEVRCA
jgi:hypothetical protein